MSLRPYIGICDFTAPDQVEDILTLFRGKTDRILHVGVMMSRKTLLGIPTRWAEVWPPKEDLKNLFYSSEAYNCLHYADYRNDYSGCGSEIREGWSHCGANLHSVQLDMVWPPSDELREAFHDFPGEVILQVGGKALDKVRNVPERVVERLEEYRGVIHRVLLDRSMGQGLGMDAQALLPFARRIREDLPEIGLGAAGGLGPTTVELIRPLLTEFPDISFEAQGQMRSDGDSSKPIEWDRARGYITSSLELLNGCKA